MTIIQTKQPEPKAMPSKPAGVRGRKVVNDKVRGVTLINRTGNALESLG